MNSTLACALALTLATGAVLATPNADARHACYGHVAYVTPITYECPAGENGCTTHYTAGLPTGCYMDPDRDK